MTENPYEPLAATAVGSVEYSFKGVVGMSDVRRACRANRFFGALFALLALFGVLVGMELRRTSGPGFVVLFASAFLLFLSYQLWRWPKRMLKANRFLLGPVRGVLRTDSLEIESHGVTTTLANGCYQVERTKSHMIGLIANGYRVLPSHLFDEFENACVLARENQRNTVLLQHGDERYTEFVPETLENTGPENALRFCGSVLNKDVAFPRLARTMRKIWFAIAMWFALAMYVVFKIWTWTDSPGLTVGFAVIAFGWVWLRIVKRLWPSLKMLRNFNDPNEHVLFAVRGWMDEKTLNMWNQPSVGRYQWTAFESYHRKDDQTLVLHLQKHVLHVGLSRRLFASDEDWAQACEYVAKHVKLDEAQR